MPFGLVEALQERLQCGGQIEGVVYIFYIMHQMHVFEEDCAVVIIWVGGIALQESLTVCALLVQAGDDIFINPAHTVKALHFLF